MNNGDNPETSSAGGAFGNASYLTQQLKRDLNLKDTELSVMKRELESAKEATDKYKVKWMRRNPVFTHSTVELQI